MLHLLIRVLPFVVGFGAFIGIARIVPGASCADGTTSAAIGRRGACSHHGGVTNGWTFLGVPAGLFAGMLTYGMLQTLSERGDAKRRKDSETVWIAAQSGRPAAAPATSGPPAAKVGEDHDTVIRRVIGTGWLLAFDYDDASEAQLQDRTVFPRWLQLAEEAGERTLCVIADCPRDGRRAFALSRMGRLRFVEPNSATAP